MYPTKEEQRELLQAVLLANESEADLGTDVKGVEGEMEGSKSSGGPSGNKGGAGKATRVAGTLNSLSGFVPSLFPSPFPSLPLPLASPPSSFPSWFGD